MGDEMMGGMTGRGRGQKRTKLEERGSSSTGATGGELKQAMGSLPATVGKGDYEQPLMMAMLQGMNELALDVADMKGAIYRSWEGPADWSYVTQGISYRKEYGKKRQEAKGTQARVGHVKNYILAAMYMACKADKEVAEEDKKRLEEIIGKFLRDADGKLQLENATNLEHLVAHCQVIQGKKKSYINILMREGDEAEAG